jgi:hypothetical protein
MTFASTLGAAEPVNPQLENPRTDYTAYTRPRGRMAVGPLKVEHGVIEEIMIGTFIPPWLAFPWLEVPVPNAYLKLRTSWWDPITLSLRAGLAYVDAKAIDKLSDEPAEASALSTTGDVGASWRIDDRGVLSLGLDYARIHAVGDASDHATTIEGASTAYTFSVRALGEWRLTRVFALSLLVRYLVHQSPVHVRGTSQSNSTTVSGDLSAESPITNRVTIVPGVSFVWERWELSGGIGYGVFYFPVLGIASTEALPVVDFGLAYRFDLYDPER